MLGLRAPHHSIFPSFHYSNSFLGGGEILGQNILWAPWRIPYIRGLEKDDDCFLCYNLAHPEEDERNLVLWRTGRSIVVLNRFPYNNGHLLVAPARHIADFTETSDDEMLESGQARPGSATGAVAGDSPARLQRGPEFRPLCGGGIARPHAHSRGAALGRRHEFHEYLQ